MNSYGIFIGINDYKGNSMDLSGCVNDAEDLAVLLGRNCKMIQTLLNSQATKGNILGQCKDFANRMKPNDWLYVTFSGHGTWVPDEDGDEPDGRDEALVPYDYPTLILDDEIHNLLSQRPDGTFLFMLTDSCHSGTVSRFAPSDALPGLGIGPSGFERTHSMKPRFLPPAQLHGPVDKVYDQTRLAELESIAGRLRAIKQREMPNLVHLAGCQDSEFSYDATFNGRPNGAATYAFLKAQEKMRKGSNFNTLYQHMRSYLPSQAYPQTPKLNTRAKVEGKLDLPWVR